MSDANSAENHFESVSLNSIRRRSDGRANEGTFLQICCYIGRMVSSVRPGHRPTIRDVAKLAKVGLMTVSRVVNEHPSVRPGTRKRVRAAIDALGYKQNEAARLLKGGRAMTIGLIVPDLSDVFFATCADTVQQIARSNGYMTLVVSSERDGLLEIQEAELMASRSISGLLVVTSLTGKDKTLRELQNTGLAIVALERPLDGMQTDCVVMENRAGAEMAIRHLLLHGHRSIACLGYDPEVYTTNERVQGYANTMRAAGLKPSMGMGINTFESARQWLAGAIGSKNRPTAIFTVNHRTSVSVVRALAEAKQRIPEDFALIGFDDFDLASVLSPALTTVAQSPVEMVKRSMALLMERINSDNKGGAFIPAKVVLPVNLIVRSSCGCHNGVLPAADASR